MDEARIHEAINRAYELLESGRETDPGEMGNAMRELRNSGAMTQRGFRKHTRWFYKLLNSLQLNR